jgi:hypothetical protein
MPIDIDSEEWKNAESRDPLLVPIRELIYSNRDQAFSIREIEERLSEEHPELFPAGMVDAGASAKTARQSIVANILFNRYWHLEVKFRYVPEGQGPEPGLYFTHDGNGVSPVAEIDHVRDSDSDSATMTLVNRFRDIENSIDEEVSELEGRLNNLEYRVRQELEY